MRNKFLLLGLLGLVLWGTAFGEKKPMDKSTMILMSVRASGAMESRDWYTAAHLYRELQEHWFEVARGASESIEFLNEENKGLHARIRELDAKVEQLEQARQPKLTDAIEGMLVFCALVFILYQIFNKRSAFWEMSARRIRKKSFEEKERTP